MVAYPQPNIIDLENRHSTNLLELILNIFVSMGTFLELLLPKSDVQGSYTEDLVVRMQLIQIPIKKLFYLL